MAINEDIKKYGPEWIILEQIVKKAEKETVEKILRENQINWGELTEQAMSHKIFPMVGYYFISNDLFSYLPPFMNQYFRICYDVNFDKTKIIKNKTIFICDLLDKNNIEYVVTKGTVLDNELYDNMGYRFLSDVDFIVKYEYKKQVVELLKTKGFIIGTVDWKTNSIREMNREEYLKYMTTPDKLPEFVCEVDNPINKYVSVGFVTSFTWSKCDYQVDIDEAFKKIVRVKIGIEDKRIPVLSSTYHFIYIILHLYKHAWVEYLSRWNNDVNLVKFGDVYHFWRKNKDELLMNLKDIIKRQGIEKPIIWTLSHTDSIFGTNMVKELGYEGWIDPIYLNSAGDEKGNTRMWKGTMRDRLCSKDRKSLYL